MANIEFEIVKHISVLSESPKGWKKELNLISWNKLEPKYDIREWCPDLEKMGKGLTFTEEESKELGKVLNFNRQQEVALENVDFLLFCIIKI
ncbi:YdbC family protein [Salipaludibacillus aurantiacus]|uniref:Transcriptional coactivator p15 (PC4) C-terminal domain-containing protein n=1 Tax=Salipaludibacillus aurantiacus TaxID=1601833 RepID=A0A1H9Q1F8_9BACI|nr:PC4/YdbC family ssDNA-binding protein [Salipaludibacillus aurantiacus]SER54426.1 hypothetical protein SAMN05518684_1029 [Salipaludibacillus aurantiacus]